MGVSVSRVTRNSSRSDQGWNNDNFLDALGGSEPARDAANQQYQRESANRSAQRERRFQSMIGEDSEDDPGTAALFGASVPGMPDKPPKAPENDEDNPDGGQIFKQMMEKAKQGPKKIEQEPVARAIYPPEAPTVAPVKAVDPKAMEYYQQQLQVWQQQMTAYSQFIASNPESAASMTMPLPPQPPLGMGGPSPAQTPPGSDLEDGEVDPKKYLPKGSGNKDSYEITGPADIYFAQLKRDSYVRSVARRDGDMEVANNPFADVGVKALTSILSDELIKQRRDRLAENGGEFETSRDEMIIPYEEDEGEVDTSYTGISYKQKLMEMKKKTGGRAPQAAAAVVSAPEPVVAQPAPTPMPVFVPEPEPVVVPTPEAVTIAEPEVVQGEAEEAGKPDFALEVAEDFDGAVVPAPAMEDSEESRRSIRTLMGLILKHRGGSGFGHGRLAEEEAKKLAENVSEVLAILRSEAGMKAAAPSPAAPSMDAMSTPLAGTVACAEAALNMYKTADSTSQKDLLTPVRDALLSTLNNLNKEIEGSSSSEVSSQAPLAPVYATTMEFPDTYKVTKPEEETMNFPDEFKVTQAEEEEIAVAPAPTGTDGNTEVLQNVFETLKSAVGDEKYGLREIGSDEVAHIKDVLLDMRSVLMDELDNGIPE